MATAQECSDDDIRIINGTVTMNGNTFNMAGGLQICVNKIWATVCQDGWHDVEGRVACRQLGLTTLVVSQIINFNIPCLKQNSTYFHTNNYTTKSVNK